MKYLHNVHSITQIQHQSEHPQDRVVHVVVVLFLLLNNNLPRVPCGTRNASIVQNATVLLIRCLHVTVPIRKFIAELATANFLDQKVLVTVMPQPLFPLVENLLFNSTFKIIKSFNTAVLMIKNNFYIQP